MAGASIIIATFNGSKYIDEAIRSALSQKGVELEVIIVEDASTDQTPEIIGRYACPQGFDFDPRVRIVRHSTNRGIEGSYRDGVINTAAPFFKLLDHDDVLPSAYVMAMQKAVLDRNPGMAFVAGQTNYMDADGRVYRRKGYQDKPEVLDSREVECGVLWGLRIPIHNGAMLIRKEAYEELGGFDYDFVLAAARSEWQIGWVNEPVLNYRNHGGNSSLNPANRWNDYTRRMRTAQGLQGRQAARYRAYRTVVDAGKMAYCLAFEKR